MYIHINKQTDTHKDWKVNTSNFIAGEPDVGKPSTQRFVTGLHVTLVSLVWLIWIMLPRLKHLLLWIRPIVHDVHERKGARFSCTLTKQVFQPEQLIRGDISGNLEVFLHSLSVQLPTVGVEAVDKRCRVDSVAPSFTPKHCIRAAVRIPPCNATYQIDLIGPGCAVGT